MNPLHDLDYQHLTLESFHDIKQLKAFINKGNNPKKLIMSEALLLAHLIYYNKQTGMRIYLFCLHTDGLTNCALFEKKPNNNYDIYFTADFSHLCIGYHTRFSKKSKNKLQNTPETATRHTQGNKITKGTGYCKKCKIENKPCALIIPPQIQIKDLINDYGTSTIRKA